MQTLQKDKATVNRTVPVYKAFSGSVSFFCLQRIYLEDSSVYCWRMYHKINEKSTYLTTSFLSVTYLLFSPFCQLLGHFSDSWQLKPQTVVKGAYQPFCYKCQVRQHSDYQSDQKSSNHAFLQIEITFIKSDYQIGKSRENV